MIASQIDQLTQQVAMSFMDPVEYANSDNGLPAGGGAGQKLAKAHSWLVLIAPYSPASYLPAKSRPVQQFLRRDRRWKDRRAAVSTGSELAGFERENRVSRWFGC